MSRKPGILVYGAGGHARSVRSAIVKADEYSIVGYVIDDAVEGLNSNDLGPTIHFEDLYSRRSYLPSHFIVAIGDNHERKERMIAMPELGFEPATIVHPFTDLGFG